MEHSILLYGGVCGSGKVQDSFNCGNITVTGRYGEKQLKVGGVVGVAEGVDIVRCYNTGNVVSLVNTLGTNNCVGGVAGLLYYIHGQDCYSIGDVTAINTTRVGAVFGAKNSGSTYANLYYNSNLKLTAIGGIDDTEGMYQTESQMKSNEFLQLLNKNTANAYKQDSNNINNGYPILSWQ